MSKLFDQLKDAARDREGGLLMGALAKKRAEEAAAAEAAAAAAQKPAESPTLPAEPSPAPVAVSPAKPRIDPAPQASPGSPIGGIALAAAIFAIAMLAWHSAPWRAPQKVKIDLDELKLDRTFNLDRPSEPDRPPGVDRIPPKGTTSPSRPS